MIRPLHGAPPRAPSAAIPPPGSALDANTGIKAHLADGYILFAQTAARTIDVTDAPTSCVISVFKNNRLLFPLTLDVSADPTWRTPAGVGQSFILPQSSDQLSGLWTLVVDKPNKTIRLVEPGSGYVFLNVDAPTSSPGDQIDLFTSGVFAGHTISSGSGTVTHQTGAPTSDGTAFIVASTANVRRNQNLGDGDRILMEGARAIATLSTNTIYSAGGAIQTGWAASGGTTGVGSVAGSPMGDATCTDLTFAATTDYLEQSITATAQFCGAWSVWAKAPSGTRKVRLEVVLKDGTVTTSADFDLTTTWRRIDMTLGSIGPAGSTGQAKVRVRCGSNAAQTVRIWGPQAEFGANYTTPTSVVITGSAGATRSGDSFYLLASEVPANMLTRGIALTWKPLYSSTEGWVNGGVTLLSLENPPFSLTGSFSSDALSLLGFVSNVPCAAGSFRLRGASTDASMSLSSPPSANPRSSSEPFSFARNDVLSLAFELYRGALKANGVYSLLGGGPLTWPANARLGIGGAPGGTVVGSGVAGSLGRYLTAA